MVKVRSVRSRRGGTKEDLRGVLRSFPWHTLPDEAVGFDLGCGSGRWARFVGRRVGRLFCVDPALVRSPLLSVQPQTYRLVSSFRGRRVSSLQECIHGFWIFAWCPPRYTGPARGIARRGSIAAARRPVSGVLILRVGQPTTLVSLALEVFRQHPACREFRSTPVRSVLAEVIAGSVFPPLARAEARRQTGDSSLLLLPLRHTVTKASSDANGRLDRSGTPIEHRYTAARFANSWNPPVWLISG